MERKPIHEIVKNPRWQAIRTQLIGKWKTDPVENCNLLKTFLGSIKQSTNDEIRIVMNYLVGSGFRTGKIKHPCVTLLRKRLSIEIAERRKENKWY